MSLKLVGSKSESSSKPVLLATIKFQMSLNYYKICYSERNMIPIFIIKISPVDWFIRGFWRSVPSLNRLLITCISFQRRKGLNRGSDSNREDANVRYISVVSSSPQLTSCSSSPSPDTSLSSVSSTSSTNSSKQTTTKMAPNDSASTMPSAPSPGLVLFNSEEQSDIVFLVGNDPQQIWRFPAHSFIVENASPVLKAIVDSGRCEEKPFHKRINWCKPEIFHLILRHIYTNEIEITSVSNALVIFTAANQLLLTELPRICLTFLYDNCNQENVLQMISHFSQFSYLRLNSTQENFVAENCSDGPNGRPLPFSQQYSNCDNILNELITKCYNTIDGKADQIMNSKEFENLNHDLIVKILSRDTLKIVSELSIFETITRWSCQQCNKQCKQLTADNKRDLLGKALYCPRYLVMTAEEFMRGPYVSDILNDEEKYSLLARLNGDSNAVLPVDLTGRKLDIPRKYNEESIVNRLPQTSTTNASNVSNETNSGIVVAKKKSASKKLLNGLGDLVICVIRILD